MRFLVMAITLLVGLSSFASAQTVTGPSCMLVYEINAGNYIQNGSQVNKKSRRGHRQQQAGVTFLPHPKGCPGKLFCGCGACVKLFGKACPRGGLAIAANWFKKYPASAPAPMRVAGRKGHVFVLDKLASGTNWWVYDYNSGGNKSRYHIRNIAGLRVVNPHVQVSELKR